jgi:hypothetical protein
MSDGERVQQMIYDWLNRHYPDGPTWYSRPAVALLPALEIRIISAFDDIEYNLGNGGWAQFLWNCFDHWRQIIEAADKGYVLIGASEQSAALDTLRSLCERDERECSETIERSIRDDDGTIDGPPYFAEFTSRSYSVPPNDWEPLFYNKGVYEKRLSWLAANEARVRKAIGMLA